ncbi:MAG: hypothetical protein ABI193_23705 [Minicystis sp.]
MSLALADLRDTSTFPPPDADGHVLVDLTGVRITGVRVAIEWVARSWFCVTGSLRHAPDRGRNLFDLANSTADKATLERWRQALIAEARRSEYVEPSRVSVTLERVERTLVLAAQITLIDGKTYPVAVTIKDGKAVVKIP